MTWLMLFFTLLTQDTSHRAMNERGAMVMGFDQEKTSHHFYLYDDGGAIDIAIKSPSDVKNRDAIRSHLPHIAMMFSGGDFNAPMLVHDSATVPGTAVLVERKDAIRYNYSETASGGRVNIVTKDSAALDALHEFLRYQISEHRTGDTVKVTRRP